MEVEFAHGFGQASFGVLVSVTLLSLHDSF